MVRMNASGDLDFATVAIVQFSSFRRFIIHAPMSTNV